MVHLHRSRRHAIARADSVAASGGCTCREKRSRKEANARAQQAAVKYVLPGLAALTVLLVVVLFLLSYRSKPSLEL